MNSKRLQSCSPKDYSSLQPIIDHYKSNCDDIKVELIQCHKPLDCVSDVINQQLPLQLDFSNLLKQLILTVSVSGAACERTFSSFIFT